jgi:hypothetical protein
VFLFCQRLFKNGRDKLTPSWPTSSSLSNIRLHKRRPQAIRCLNGHETLKYAGFNVCLVNRHQKRQKQHKWPEKPLILSPLVIPIRSILKKRSPFRENLRRPKLNWLLIKKAMSITKHGFQSRGEMIRTSDPHVPNVVR